MIFIITLISYSDNDENNCDDCGGSLNEGYLYKTVEADDIPNLGVIDVTAGLGNCISFKMDIEDQTFSEATVVADCCCSQYE